VWNITITIIINIWYLTYYTVAPDEHDITHIYTREELLSFFKSSIEHVKEEVANDEAGWEDVEEEEEEKAPSKKSTKKQSVDSKKAPTKQAAAAAAVEPKQAAKKTPSAKKQPANKKKQQQHEHDDEDGGEDGEDVDMFNDNDTIQDNRWTHPHIVVGMVGYPNVGKSSVVNVLCGRKRVAVGATPGKTKHLQTLFIAKDIILCDCPGLVFPSANTTKDDMVCDGVLPIDQMREYRGPIALLCQRIPPHVFELLYGLVLPKKRKQNNDEAPPLGVEELLYTFARARGMMSQKDVPNAPAAARLLLKDYVNGKLLYCHPPPLLPQQQQAEADAAVAALVDEDEIDENDEDYFTDEDEEAEETSANGDKKQDAQKGTQEEQDDEDGEDEEDEVDLFVEEEVGEKIDKHNKKKSAHDVKFNEENVNSALLEEKEQQRRAKRGGAEGMKQHYYYDPLEKQEIHAGSAKGEKHVHATLPSNKQEKILDVLAKNISSREDAIDKMRQQQNLTKDEQQQLKALKRRFVYMKKFI